MPNYGGGDDLLRRKQAELNKMYAENDKMYGNYGSGGSGGSGCGGVIKLGLIIVVGLVVYFGFIYDSGTRYQPSYSQAAPASPTYSSSAYTGPPVKATIEEPTVQVQHIKHDTGLEFSLDGIDFDADAVNTHFFVKNLSGKSQNFEIAPSLNYFKLVDNIGREWPATKIPHIVTKLDNGEKSVDIGPRFDNTLLRDDAVTFVVLTVKNLKGVNEASWKIKINR